MSVEGAQPRSRFAARLEETWLDAHAALRALRRDPGFAVTAVVTLTIAIGLNVTVFAVMDAVLHRGFPLVEDNDRLLYMQERHPHGARGITFADFVEWRAQAESFEDIAFVDGRRITLSDAVGGRSVDTSVSAITANTFGLLGVRPFLGRDFGAADEVPGAPQVAILSHRFWQARFGGQADIVGRTIAIEGAPATVIGVMPERFEFAARQSMWLPLARTLDLEQRIPNGYVAVGRLAPDATQQSARAELAAINERLAADYPATNRDVVPIVEPYARVFHWAGCSRRLRCGVGRGLVRAADCVRESRQPHAGTHLRPLARARDSARPRRGALAARQTARHGEPAARGGERGAGLVRRRGTGRGVGSCH